MGRIYKDQTNLRLTLTTSVNITGALAKKIKYCKPDATEGEVSAGVSDAANGVIYYDFNGELDQSGKWQFWAYITFSDSSVAAGEHIDIYVYEEGKNY